MKKCYALILFSVFLLWLPSCQHKDDVQPAAGGGNTGNGNGNGTGTDTSLCFERDVLPIFVANCAKAGCHDAATATEGFVFTSHQTITSRDFVPGNPNATELYEKITEDNPSKIMPPPPNPPLTQQQKDVIRQWIQRGAPNTTGCASTCDSNKNTFAAGIQPLLNQYCKGCHSSAAASGGVSLDNYSGVRTVALNGKLSGVLRRKPGYPAMPQGGNQLSECQIRQVEKWIEAGAQNN